MGRGRTHALSLRAALVVFARNILGERVESKRLDCKSLKLAAKLRCADLYTPPIQAASDCQSAGKFLHMAENLSKIPSAESSGDFDCVSEFFAETF